MTIQSEFHKGFHGKTPEWLKTRGCMAKSSTDTYRTNAKSRAKHQKDNGKGGKYAHTNEYKKKHYRERKKLGLKVGDKRDASKQSNGSYKAESLKINRGRK